MACSGEHGTTKGSKDLRLIIPFSFNSLRIPNKLVPETGSGRIRVFGFGASAKTWPIEIGQDETGAFLGRGWPEVAAASGAGEGWLLVLRHHGGGLLTIKAFDSSCCLKELDAPPPTVENTPSTITGPFKPQFICALTQDLMEKMLVPPDFLERYIRTEHLKDSVAILTGPLGDVSQVELETNQSSVVFAGGWSDFLALHHITVANTLLFKYKNHMEFTVNVFEHDGFLRLSKQNDSRMRQDIVEVEETSVLNYNCKNIPTTSDRPKQSKWIRKNSIYEVGTRPWIKKEISINNVKKEVSLPKSFCDAIELWQSCTITLKTCIDSNKSWMVSGYPRSNGGYFLGKGWRRFSQDNILKEGDTCTFYLIENKLWHAVIMRHNECYEIPSASSGKRKTNDDRPECSNGQKRKIDSLSRCVFQIKPTAWIKKKINTSTIQTRLYLPTVFCQKMGILKRCMVTLKTSMSSSSSWDVVISPYKSSNYHVTGLGWRRFYKENKMKVGDVCTFNILETTLWQAVITQSNT